MGLKLLEKRIRMLSGKKTRKMIERRGRDPELRAIIQRCLDEAAARGFTSEDVARQMKALASRQGG